MLSRTPVAQDCFRERKLPRPFQFAQQRNRKLRAVYLPPKRHGERAGAGAKLVGEFAWCLIDVHSDPDNRAERLAAASLRLNQNTGDLASADVDIVRRFDYRLEPRLTVDRIGDSLRRPGR